MGEVRVRLSGADEDIAALLAAWHRQGVRLAVDERRYPNREGGVRRYGRADPYAAEPEFDRGDLRA